MVVNGAIMVVQCIHMNAARIILVAQLGKPCIQIKEVSNWWGAVSGLIGFGVLVVIVEGFTLCHLIMANQLAAVGVLYNDFYGTVSTKVIVINQK